MKIVQLRYKDPGNGASYNIDGNNQVSTIAIKTLNRLKTTPALSRFCRSLRAQTGSRPMNSDIQTKFESYPKNARRQLENVRKLILKIAAENDLGDVEETLKWGEPSYLIKGGTTIRIDWKPEDPDSIKVFFHCQTRLIETFKEIYPREFRYEGKRAIIIPLKTNVEQVPLGHCIRMALKYHSLKHLPLLGA